MRVIVYSDKISTTAGGAEIYLHELCSELFTRGVDVLCVTLKNEINTRDHLYNILELKSSHSFFGFDFSLILRVHTVLYAFNPDILHISSPVPNDVFLILVAKKLRIPIIMTYHADFSGFLGKIFMRVLQPIFYPLVSKIFVQSSRDRENLIGRGIPESKIDLFYFNGVDSLIFHPPKYPKTDYSVPREILFIGKIERNHRHKGFDLLFKAFVELRKKGVEVKLRVIGGGDQEAFYKESEIALNLGSIEFLGHISVDSLVLNLQTSDILVLPSKNNGEGFGKVVLEALACDLPVVVSKYAGISYLIEKYKCGKVIDPSDTQAFVYALESVLNDHDLWSQYKKNGRVMIRSENLYLSSTVEYTITTYNSLIYKGKKQTREIS